MRARGFLVAALTAAALATSAGAAEQRAGADLTTPAGIDRYLISLGVDPGTVVVQRGRRNYAGPNCPGKGWNCTTARRVVQVSRQSNFFQCTPAGPGTNAATNTCVIVQASTTGTNNAICRMSDDGASVSQSCNVTQSNQSGSNLATVDLFARARGGTSHAATQGAAVTQTNVAGLNDLNSLQKADQYVTVATGGSQSQEAHQTLDASQSNGTGNNTSQVKQFQVIRATANIAGALTQHQNEDSLGPNLDADIDQESDSGTNHSLLDQGTNLNLQATSRTSVTQVQGSPTGGVKGTVDQSSSAPSTSVNHQDENINAHANTPPGTLTQTQFGPMECCTSQLGNSSNMFDINQDAGLFADNGFQSNTLIAHCLTDGTCNISQRSQRNDETTTNSDSCTAVAGPCAAEATITCTPGEACTTGAPLSSLAKDGCDDTTAEGTCRPEGPYADNTFAFGEDTIDFRIVYTNAGTGTAHGVMIFDTVPGAMSFVGGSCEPACSIGDFNTLGWDLGDVPAGETRTMFFSAIINSSGGFDPITNTAGGSNAEDESFEDSATVTSCCPID